MYVVLSYLMKYVVYISYLLLFLDSFTWLVGAYFSTLCVFK